MERSQPDDLMPAADELAASIVEAQAGDEGAFRVLYRATQPALLRYVRGLVADDAEDVTSETWLQVARDLHTFRGDYAGFRAWTATVARHRALDHVRRMRRRPATAVPVELLADLADRADTSSEASDALSTAAAVRLIASLPQDQAEAVLLRVVMGLDATAAGKVLGKRAGAVRTATYRGLKRLAQMLERTET